jgi:hypothetical protein
VAKVDSYNFLRTLAKGKTMVRAVYKGVVSNNLEVNVVENINTKIVQGVKQEIKAIGL